MADLKCYYCHRKIKQAVGTARTFIVEDEIDPNSPSEIQQRDRFRCEESPSYLHFPEAYKIVEATNRPGM